MHEPANLHREWPFNRLRIPSGTPNKISTGSTTSGAKLPRSARRPRRRSEGRPVAPRIDTAEPLNSRMRGEMGVVQRSWPAPATRRELDISTRRHGMKADIDPENADLFDGWGNGSLHIYLARDPERWRGAELQDFLETRLGFNLDDWDALFVNVLHVSMLNAEDLQQLHGRNLYVEADERIDRFEWERDLFRDALPGYPMLGRIWTMYEDFVFRLEELPQLRGECVKLKSETTQPEAVKALRKLIYACDEAAKRGFSLILSGD